MEDAHVANGKFNSNDNEALFGVFDGHGGREVAVFSNKHYENILQKEFKGTKDVKEGLRVSFLNVDVELKTPSGQNELGDLRREKPPKKPALLNILSDDREKKEDEQTNEEMMLDSIGCTSNVIYINKDMKKIFVANAGDSRCVMGKDGQAVEMSIDHKPES